MVKARTALYPHALLQDQPLQLDAPVAESHHTAALMEDPDQTALFQPGPLRDLPLLQLHAHSEAFHHTAAPTAVKDPTAWYLQDQHRVQQLLLDAPMAVFLHTAAPTVARDRTVSYLLDHQRDQLKAMNICLLALMAELDQIVRLDHSQLHSQHGHRLLLPVVLTVEALPTAALTVDKVPIA